MNFVNTAMLITVFCLNVIETFRIGDLKRGGSDPSRAFFLLRDFQNFQKRLSYNQRITVRQRHKFPKNRRIFDKNGRFVKKSSRSDRDKSRKRFLSNFHTFSPTLNQITV